MKTLLIIRHAKSSWNDPNLSDFQRPLNERGKNDAPLMATKIKERKIGIDTFISSPAVRAKKTAEIFMHQLEADKKELILIPDLYEATLHQFYNTIGNLKDKWSTVALFAHNPGITDFINSLECYSIYDMPTCAVFASKIKIKKWKNFKEANKDFLFFDYPKNENY